MNIFEYTRDRNPEDLLPKKALPQKLLWRHSKHYKNRVRKETVP